MNAEDSPAWPQISAALSNAPLDTAIGVSVRSLSSPSTFESNGATVFPAASTIKTLILVALARAVDAGTVALDDVASTGPATRVPGSGVLNWLADGLQLSLRDLAWLMIAISDNTASNVLIDAAGTTAIDECRRSLGLDSTALNRRLLGRLPDPGAPENLTTATDLTALLAAIWRDEAASPDCCAWMRSILADQSYRDRIPRHLPETVTYAGKTGSLPGYCHDCGVISGPGGSAAIAVLTSGFDDKYAADAFAGSVALAAAGDLNLATPQP